MRGGIAGIRDVNSVHSAYVREECFVRICVYACVCARVCMHVCMRVLQAILQQQQADWSAAQSIYDNPCVPGNPGAIQSLAYPRAQEFILRNRFWGMGDATITGPGSRTWFKMVRDNVVLFPP